MTVRLTDGSSRSLRLPHCEMPDEVHNASLSTYLASMSFEPLHRPTVCMWSSNEVTCASLEVKLKEC
jgi:hypothetical protein